MLIAAAGFGHISHEVVPSGHIAQIKIFLPETQPVTKGKILPRFSVSPDSAQIFVREGEQPARFGVRAALTGSTPVTASVTTESGGPWLSVDVSPISGTAFAYQIDGRVDPSGLARGSYKGAIALNSPGTQESRVPVTMEILSANPPPLNVSGAEQPFTAEFGSPTPGIPLRVESGGVRSQFTVRSPDVSLTLSRAAGVTPETVDVSVSSTRIPGDYVTNLEFNSITSRLEVPVKFTITANKLRPPVIANVRPSVAEPGTRITLYGMGIGPAEGARVFFDGIPVPQVTGTSSQLRVTVPESLSGRTASTVEIEYNGAKSSAWGLPLVP